MLGNLGAKIAVVTGGTAGIGRETVRALALQGARVLFTGRNADAAKSLIDELKVQAPVALVEFLPVDFASLKSVKQLAQQIQSRVKRIDILVNNAGLNTTKLAQSEDGFELTLAVNHLAPFLLTHLLLDTVADGGRIINVASKMHSWRNMNFDDIELKKDWGAITAYSQSKLANVMFTYYLARQLSSRKISVNCLHPGVIASDITREMPGFVRFVVKLVLKNTAQGAETSVFLASSNEVAGITSKYFDDKKAIPSSKESYDEEKQEKLWRMSKKMVQAYF